MISARMLKASATTLKAIYEHPYNQALKHNTLQRNFFKEYLLQDQLYLKKLGEVLNIIIPKLNDEQDKAFLSKLATETIHYENTMQDDYIGKPLTLHKAIPIKMSRVVSEYTQFLLITAQNQVPLVALASIFPCFWSYCQLGQQMAGYDKMDCHQYSKWIASYANDEYFQVTQTLQTLIDDLAINASTSTQEDMIAAFDTSAKLELAFYEQTYPQVQLVEKKALTLSI